MQFSNSPIENKGANSIRLKTLLFGNLVSALSILKMHLSLYKTMNLSQTLSFRIELGS